jgi:hypothetical protein
VLVACGSGDEAGHFDDRVDAVRAAVAAGDRHAALAGLEDLGHVAMAAHAEGQLDEAEIQEVAVLIEHGRVLVDQQLPEPTTTSTAPPPPPPPAPEAVDVDDDDDDDDEKEKRPGRGQGRGNG